jgi:hypothetical protein
MSKAEKFSKVQYNRKQLGICPITGISVTIEVPVILNKVYSYPHPFSIIPNAIGIAKLSYKDQLSLGNEIMAGVCISLLSHYNLISDKLSSIERNLVLREANAFTLYTLASTIVQASKFSINNWPKISLAEFSCYTITDYIKIIRGEAEVSNSASTYSYSTTTKQKKEKKEKNVSSDLRKLIKNLIIGITPLFPAKVIQVLQIMSQGNNLYNLNEALKTKLITKLESIEDDRTFRLAQIIRDSSNAEDEIDSQVFGPIPTSKTLAEILAEKQGKTVEKVEEKEEEVKTIEDLFYPTFKHLNCEDCEFDFTSCKTLGYCYLIEKNREEQTASILGTIKEVADELGIESNLEYIEASPLDNEEEEEEDNESYYAEEDGEVEEEQSDLSEEEGEDDEF